MSVVRELAEGRLKNYSEDVVKGHYYTYEQRYKGNTACGCAHVFAVSFRKGRESGKRLVKLCAPRSNNGTFVKEPVKYLCYVWVIYGPRYG